MSGYRVDFSKPVLNLMTLLDAVCIFSVVNAVEIVVAHNLPPYSDIINLVCEKRC